MRYESGESGEPITVTFDTYRELQALGWACSDMRAAKPEDYETITSYNSVLRATEVQHKPSESYDFSLRGEEASIVLSVLRQWVALGPPAKEGRVTDAARAKSYETANRIVTQAVELT